MEVALVQPASVPALSTQVDHDDSDNYDDEYLISGVFDPNNILIHVSQNFVNFAVSWNASW